MKKIMLLAGMLLCLTTVMAQDNPYIVKTKGVKKTVRKAAASSDSDKKEEKKLESQPYPPINCDSDKKA